MAPDSHLDSSIQFLLNGRAIRAEGVHAQTTLLDFLRAQGLTGAKEGCAEGECGACTVVLVKSGGYLPVNSCLLFLPMLAGQEVYTVEALAGRGPLAEVQQAMVEHGGSQCGYCTPGFMMTVHALLDQNPDPTDDEIRQALSGNLCRCTGYTQMYQAIRAAIEAERKGREAERV